MEGVEALFLDSEEGLLRTYRLSCSLLELGVKYLIQDMRPEW